jgi:hypothetical protein
MVVADRAGSALLPVVVVATNPRRRGVAPAFSGGGRVVTRCVARACGGRWFRGRRRVTGLRFQPRLADSDRRRLDGLPITDYRNLLSYSF